MNKKILVGYQKGGVGKTTVAINLAYYLQSLNKNNKKQLLLVDADSGQESCSLWSAIRNGNPKIEEKINCVSLEIFKNNLQDFNYTIFDVTGQIDFLMNLLDEEKINTMLIPISFNRIDVEPLKELFKSLINLDLKLLNPVKVFIFFNKIDYERVTLETVRNEILKMIEFADLRNIEVTFNLNTIGNHRKIFDKEFREGKSSLEGSSRKKSSLDFNRLFADLQDKGAF